MAEKKISQLTAKGTDLAATDLIMISEVSGSSYISKYVTGSQIAAGGGGSTDLTIDTKTGSYTLILADSGKLIELNSSSSTSLGVPLNSTDAFPIGSQILISQIGAGEMTVTPVSGVTIRSRDNELKLQGQYSAATLIKRATDEWLLVGDLKA